MFFENVSRELAKHKLNLVGVQDIRWDKGVTEPADDCTFFYRNGNADYHIGTGFFVHKGIISAFKSVEFVSNRFPYIILRGCWCDVIVLNVHAPTEDECNDTRGSSDEKLRCVFYQFPKYHIKILLEDFNSKVGRENIFKLTVGNDSLHKTRMIMVLLE
jgi:hypothetical protein